MIEALVRAMGVYWGGAQGSQSEVSSILNFIM